MEQFPQPSTAPAGLKLEHIGQVLQMGVLTNSILDSTGHAALNFEHIGMYPLPHSQVLHMQDLT